MDPKIIGIGIVVIVVIAAVLMMGGGPAPKPAGESPEPVKPDAGTETPSVPQPPIPSTSTPSVPSAPIPPECQDAKREDYGYAASDEHAQMFCIVDLAKEREDYGLCNALMSVEYFAMSGISASYGEEQYGGCLVQVGGVKEDPNACEPLKGSNKYNRCITSLAEEINDASICERIAGDSWYNTCLEEA